MLVAMQRAIGNSVGDRLRQSREQAGLSQSQLAEEIGATRSAIAQVEAGISNSLNAENLAKAAQRLGKSAVWLATGDGPELSFDALGVVFAAMSAEDRQAAFDFIEYKIERPTVPYVSEKSAASYTAMIERLKDDMTRRINGYPKDPAE
jgi:transcriptional regulator with XRE-family HTH domain